MKTERRTEMIWHAVLILIVVFAKITFLEEN